MVLISKWKRMDCYKHFFTIFWKFKWRIGYGNYSSLSKINCQWRKWRALANTLGSSKNIKCRRTGIRVVSPRWPVRPGSFRSGSFRPRKWVDSPRKVSRFAPLNCYYIIIDEVFFDNCFVIIYLLVVCKKNNNSFILVYFNYLFINCIQKKNNSFILVYFCQRSQPKLFLQIFKKPYKNSKKFFFCTNPKVHEMTKMLCKCANNLFFNELRIKC